MNEAAFDFGFGFFEAQVFGFRQAADGDQYFFRRDRLLLAGRVGERDGAPLASLFDGLHFRARSESGCLFS